MKQLRLYRLLLLFLSLAAPAWAVDHNNLDEGRPLRIEDAYPIAYGEISAEAGAQINHLRRGRDRVSFPLEILYGAYWNLHVGMGATLATQPHSIDEGEKSGDIRVFGLYNLNQETLRLPALATKVTLNLPTGIHSHGTDVTIKGIATRTIGHGRVHFNGSYEFLDDARNKERSGRYEIVLGGQYPLGYPRAFTTSLLLDVFTQQSPRTGGQHIAGGEIGLRRQIAPLLVIDMGIGSEFIGPSDRTIFFATVGASVGF